MTDRATNPVEIVIKPRSRDLGGFTVGRILPFAKRRMVGPFIFLDEIGPAHFSPGAGIDVRPHPHIGLATVTYLFDGELRHRDNLGFDLVIKPGDVNWMTAGSGIVHSERTGAGRRAAGQRMHGMQSWIALPEEHAETNPGFFHHPAESLPVLSGGNYNGCLIAGEAFGYASPVQTFSPMFYAAIDAGVGADLELPENFRERAIYVVTGAVTTGAERYDAQTLIVFNENAPGRIRVVERARLMLLGGDPLGERIIWWNFVASSQARIDKAKTDWRHSIKSNFVGATFSLPPGETEFIPLPDG